MSMLGPYASYNEETGFLSYEPGVNHVGIFERNGLSIRGIIHVGMWDFYESECYVKLVGPNVVAVEAHPVTFETLSKPVADKCGFRSYGFAAYDEDDRVLELAVRPDRLDCSSFYEPGFPGRVEVRTKKLDTLIKEEGIDMSQYDFLNIDTEGAELHVLRGFEENLHHINVIDMEAAYEAKPGSDASYESITQYLEERGFVEVEKSNSFAELGWGDVIFSRKELI